MRCPFCGNIDTQVKDSRPAEDHVAIRRRPFCPACGGRFTTYERVETVPITVVKRTGTREIFSRSKLLHGLVRACEKTGLEPARLESVVDDIELELQQQRHGREVSSAEIGELVLQQLGMSKMEMM